VAFFIFYKMTLTRIITHLALLVFYPIIAQSQGIEKTNFAVCSHPVTVDKVVRDSASLTLFITLENHLSNGYFCASGNIVLQDLIFGTKAQLIRAEGVPVCPEMYHFKWSGEKLHFSLVFQAVDTSIHFVDLIELCDENCLVINGLFLDQSTNNLLNQGFDAYTHNNLSLALHSFKEAIKLNPDYPYGFLYGNVIKILLDQNNKKEAENWAWKLRTSRMKDKFSVLKQIELEKGFSIE